MPVIGEHLFHRLPELRAEAARTLATLGPAAEPALDDLIQLLADDNEDVCMAAAYALGRLAMQPDKVLPNLILAIENRNLVRPVAVAIAAYGCAARPVVTKLEGALLRALSEAEYGAVDCLVHAIEAAAADPAGELRQVLADCDREFQPQAEQLLADRQRVPVGSTRRAPGSERAPVIGKEKQGDAKHYRTWDGSSPPGTIARLKSVVVLEGPNPSCPDCSTVHN